jgi:hypothetical protein
MPLTSFTPEQARVLDEAQTIDALHRSLLLREVGLNGGYQWKTVGGEEYLTRFWTDPTSKQKQARSRGRRSPVTEAEYRNFYEAREKVVAERRSLNIRLGDVARAARAFRLVQAPLAVADVFRAFERAGLWQTCMLLGGWAVQAHAVEARVRMDVSLSDIDLLVPDELISDVLPLVGSALGAVCPDADWKAEGTALVGAGGLRIHICDVSGLLEAFLATQPESDAFLSVTEALDAGPRPGFVIGRDGLPAPVATLDPTAHAVLKASQAAELGNEGSLVAALDAVQLARLIDPRTGPDRLAALDDLQIANHDRIRHFG